MNTYHLRGATIALVEGDEDPKSTDVGCLSIGQAWSSLFSGSRLLWPAGSDVINYRSAPLPFSHPCNENHIAGNL